MSQITVDKFLHGIISISKTKPTYKVGHDGSDGSCDGIGFIRGGLLRGGATKIVNMKEVNQFARKTAKNLRKADSSFVRGDILLKSKDTNDNSMPLPSKYRIGGNDYNGDGTNYVDIAVIIKENPVEIIFMTKNGLFRSTDIKDWDFVCELPYVEYGGNKKVVMSAIVNGEGAEVKLFADKSFACNDFLIIPDDTMVIINDKSTPWSYVSFGDKKGYVLTKFIKEFELEKTIQISQEERLELDKAYKIIGKILGYIK